MICTVSQTGYAMYSNVLSLSLIEINGIRKSTCFDVLYNLSEFVGLIFYSVSYFAFPLTSAFVTYKGEDKG